VIFSDGLVSKELEGVSLASQLVNISVHYGGGACVDPAADSLGILTWHRDLASDSTGVSTSSYVTAQFLSAPYLAFPPVNLEFLNSLKQPTFCAASYPATEDAGSLSLSGPSVNI
jgi:hypothetical protein